MGRRRARNARVVWNWLGVESMVPKLPALMRTQMSRAAAMTNMKGAPKACRWRMDSTPRHTTTMLRSQKPRKHAHKTPRRIGGCRPHDPQHGVNRSPTYPRLNAEPAACDDGTQNGGQVRTTHSKRRANEDREWNAVLCARMRIEQHGHKHNEIAKQHRADCLLPIHAFGDERGSELIGGDLHGHGEPEGDVVVHRPCALRGRGGSQVSVGEGWVDDAQRRSSANRSGVDRIHPRKKIVARMGHPVHVANPRYFHAPPRASRRR